MALKYSETFKISSRAEASLVLKLTQQLNGSLEQYFLNCKGLEVQDSGLADKRNEIYETSKILPVSDYRNRKLGLQNRNLQKFEDPNEIPFMSAQSITYRYEEPSVPIPTGGFSSTSCNAKSPSYSNATESIFFNTRAHVYEPFQTEQNTEHSESCASHISLNRGNDVKTNIEFNIPAVSSDPEKKTQSDRSMESFDSDFDASSLHASSTQETECSSQAQSKTSKTLSPDILQLLKGKDANTVTNILKTLSPFYPALQDVNLEILAQVLVNTGALD